MRVKVTKGYLSNKTTSQGKWKDLPEKDLFIRDRGLAGFGVKVTPRGTVSFIFENSIRGRGSKRVTLGRYPSLSLTEAKDKAHQTSKLYRDGVDPHELEKQKQQERARELARDIPFREVMASYFEFRTEKTRTEYLKVINSLYPDWLDKPVRSITEQEIAKRYKDKLSKGHKAQAQKGLRYLKAIFNHGMKTKIHGEVVLTENPVVLAEALLPKEDKKPVAPKTRMIEPKDLFKFIRGIMTETHETARDLLLLQLFTGLRDSEAKGLKWEDVDFESKTFTVRDTKGKRDHTLPMGSFLYGMFVSRFHAKGRHKVYVFPNPKGTDRIGSIRKQILKIIKKTGIEFSSHDLRRSYATFLEQELGARQSVIGRLLNHSPVGVTAKHYLKTKASSYSDLQNQLFRWAIANHDWTDDTGHKRITEAWANAVGLEEVYSRNDLIYVMYGDAIQQIINKDIESIDLEYLSQATGATFTLLKGLPDELINKLHAGELYL